MTDKFLFPMPKPDLVMVVDNLADSDDPLEAFLQRRGWCLHRVATLQASISKKLTIDFLLNDVEELNSAELELQRDLEAYLCSG